jgi:hypothetical protein
MMEEKKISLHIEEDAILFLEQGLHRYRTRREINIIRDTLHPNQDPDPNHRIKDMTREIISDTNLKKEIEMGID